jgi:hypothetical protein
MASLSVPGPLSALEVTVNVSEQAILLSKNKDNNIKSLGAFIIMEKGFCAKNNTFNVFKIKAGYTFSFPAILLIFDN